MTRGEHDQDGFYHDVDSSDMAFQIAASMGLQKVFVDAHPIMLEPVMNVEVTARSEQAGDVIGGMLTYESTLRSMTGGRGGYSMEFSHYEEVPAFIAEKVVKEAKAEKEKAEKH